MMEMQTKEQTAECVVFFDNLAIDAAEDTCMVLEEVCVKLQVEYP